MSPPPKPKPALPDWGPTRDPKRNEQISREVDAELRQEDAARKAHLARLKAMEPTLLDRRTRCAGVLDIFDTDWRTRKNNWENTIIDLTQVHTRAFKNFTGEFGKGSEANTKMWYLSALALGAITQGGLAGLATFAAEQWLTSAAQKTMLGGGAEALGNELAGLLQIPPSNLVPDNSEAAPIPSPDDYQGELAKILNNLDNQYLDWRSTQQKLINNLPLEKFEFFDPSGMEAKINNFLNQEAKEINSKPFAKEQLGAVHDTQYTSDVIKKSAMQKELETSLWIQYFRATLPMADGAARSSGWWGTAGRMPEFLIDKMADLKLIDKHSGYDDVDVLKLARPPDGREPQRVVKQALYRAQQYRPLRKWG